MQTDSWNKSCQQTAQLSLKDICSKVNGGGGAKSVVLKFISWALSRYCSMKLWTSIYHAKYEPDPSPGLVINFTRESM